jgi:hypothetical protein
MILQSIDRLLRDFLVQIAPIPTRDKELERLYLWMGAHPSFKKIRVEHIVGMKKHAGETVLVLPSEPFQGFLQFGFFGHVVVTNELSTFINYE